MSFLPACNHRDRLSRRLGTSRRVIISINHRRDTRFMRREKCAKKRLVGAYETDWAGNQLQLRHQPKYFSDQTDAISPVG